MRRCGHCFAYAVLILSMLAVAGCDSLNADEDRAFENTVWRLEAFLTQDTFPTLREPICERGGVSCVDDDRIYTATFRSNGSLSARADCNTCGGSYVREGQSLSVEAVLCTEIACGTNSRGSAFAAALGAARAYSIRDNRMLLAYGDGRGLLLRATSSRPAASPRAR